MIKITIINTNRNTDWKRQFETQEELDAWLSVHIEKNTFGLPERPELALNEETGEMEPTGVILPAEYTIEIEDITAQIEQEKINAEAKKFLSETDWKCQRHADQKALGISPSLSEEEFQALLLARQEARNRIM
jgi:hypothetical protein